MSLAFLLDRYDRTLPSYEQHAFVQMKFTLVHDEPLHVGWERVRAFALQYLAGERRLAAVLVLHNPGAAGSGNAPHIHVIVPARQLTANRFGATDKRLCLNQGQGECWGAWQALLAKGGVGDPVKQPRSDPAAGETSRQPWPAGRGAGPACGAGSAAFA